MNRTGRFAPSPTGDLHLGNLRTALLAWLFARSQGAPILLRIEDLDSGRSRKEFERRQIADIRAVGLDWDGEPVRQSERAALYERAIARLDTYPCWCSRRDVLEAAAAPHVPRGTYPGTCRRLTASQRAERIRQGRKPALRVRADVSAIGFTDRIHGSVTGVVDDFVVRRADGDYAYNLAVVVDDLEQSVGEVVRGDDLLESTGRQVWLAGALGRVPPAYAHVPLLRGSDGRRLAKRHGAVTLGERLAAGDTVPRLIGRLGASVGIGDGAPATAAELLRTFSVSHRMGVERDGQISFDDAQLH